MSSPRSSIGPGEAAQRPRILVVDDSVVVRGLFGRWIELDGRFQMLPTCANGEAAVVAAARHRPKVIVLDLEMPVMDGITALPGLLEACPDAAIMIASTLTRHNAKLAMRCLALGATEILPKPDTNRDLTMSQSFREEFMAKIAALSGARTGQARQPVPRPQPFQRPQPVGHITPRPGGKAHVPVPRACADRGTTRVSGQLASHVTRTTRYVVIGASTGGPRAVAQVLHDMKSVLPHVTTLIVQHMPPIFTASFAEQMSLQLGLPVREPVDGEGLETGTVFVAPGGRHMGLKRARGTLSISLDDGPPVRFCRPSVDVLFQDAAAELGASCVAVVLTGMGSDGTDGAAALRASGTAVIAQDEETSVVWGMPGSVVKAGHASLVMPLGEIGPSLRELIASAQLMNPNRKTGTGT